MAPLPLLHICHWPWLWRPPCPSLGTLCQGAAVYLQTHIPAQSDLGLAVFKIRWKNPSNAKSPLKLPWWQTMTTNPYPPSTPNLQKLSRLRRHGGEISASSAGRFNPVLPKWASPVGKANDKQDHAWVLENHHSSVFIFSAFFFFLFFFLASPCFQSISTNTLLPKVTLNAPRPLTKKGH